MNGQTESPARLPRESAVQISALVRRFGEVTALDQVELDVRAGEFFSLLGPSGCGKTTLLRLIAGLDVPDSGTIHIGGVNAARVPAHRRPVNTVFQSYALFPHLSVWENVAFGLRMKKVPKAELETRVRRVLDMVEIASLAARKPSQLSGGQRQRVALARAIVNEPKVLLLDEPLGALDLKLRKQLQVELRRLQRQLGITFIYVTHDQEEALSMSDRIAVMSAGKIEQMGGASEVYERPRTRFVAQFLGSCNLIEARISARNGGGCWVDTAWGQLRLELAEAGRFAPGGKAVTLAIRPENLRLQTPNGTRGENCLLASIRGLIYGGAATEYLLSAGDCQLRACALSMGRGQSARQVGQVVAVELPAANLVALED